MRAGKGLVRAGRQEHAAHELLISSVIVADVPLAGLSFFQSRCGAREIIRRFVMDVPAACLLAGSTDRLTPLRRGLRAEVGTNAPAAGELQP